MAPLLDNTSASISSREELQRAEQLDRETPGHLRVMAEPGSTAPAAQAASNGSKQKATAASSVSTLLNSAVGAGVLSLAFAYRAAGWAGGLITTLVSR